MSDQRVLITGASTGIGAALARTFAHRNHSLVIVARRKSLLQKLANELTAAHGVRVLTIALDLSKKGSAKRLMARLDAANIAVHILVNNAGVAKQGAAATMTYDDVSNMVAVNVHTLTVLTHLVLPGMLERGQGRILNVASVVAFQPAPALALYAATKAFVLSLTESLSEELLGKGITVTALCPGLTNTAMVQDVKSATSVPDFMVATPEEVAEAGYQACMAGEVIRVPGAVNQLAVAWSQFQPRWLVRAVTGHLGRAALSR